MAKGSTNNVLKYERAASYWKAFTAHHYLTLGAWIQDVHDEISTCLNFAQHMKQ
jgi:hypothetical protein